MKNLALFDVDGTLIESNEIDTDCYLETIKRVLQIDQVDDDWSHYKHVTDTGILTEIYQTHFHHEITEEVHNEFKTHFLQTIKDKLYTSKVRIRPVLGVHQAIKGLLESDKWIVALAGGAWRDSIKLKLQNAMLSILDDLSIFSSDDAISRTEIMSIAIRSMLTKTGLDRFGKIVYLGDAVWDVKASRESRIAFLGVGIEKEKLLIEGASHGINNYSNIHEFTSLLERCTVPS